MTISPSQRTGRRAAWPFALVLAAVLALAHSPSAWAVDPAQQVIDNARRTFETLLDDPDQRELQNVIAQAKGVLIFPRVIKGGFILAGEGGTGVLLVKGEDGVWSSPAFYTLAAGSIGLQIGGQVSQVVLTVMNDGAVDAILSNRFKVGADASVAVGPFGKGVEASTTTNLNVDVYAFSKTAGLFGGGALEGAAIVARDKLNQAYYGPGYTPQDIVLHRKVHNPAADPLRRSLMR